MLDPILGGVDRDEPTRGDARRRRRGRARARRRVPPGWDEAVRLDEDPATIPDPADVDVPAELRAQIEAHMAKYPDRHSAALPALGAAQAHHGWCSPEAITQVAAVMQVTPAYLSSVATFYDMLRTSPTGERYLYVCTSVACHLRNAKAVLRRDRRRGASSRGSRAWSCASSSASAPATWRRWPRWTGATSARSTSPTRRSSWRR